MASQFPFPARSSWLVSGRTVACGRLDALERDVLSTKAAIRTALDALAARHNIPAKDITYAVESYVDDMLSDAIHNVERKLEREILEDEDRGFQSSSP